MQKKDHIFNFRSESKILFIISPRHAPYHSRPTIYKTRSLLPTSTKSTTLLISEASPIYRCHLTTFLSFRCQSYIPFHKPLNLNFIRAMHLTTRCFPHNRATTMTSFPEFCHIFRFLRSTNILHCNSPRSSKIH